MFDSNPLVNTTPNTVQYNYRAYVPWNQRSANYTVGRAGYTGTGEVGNGHDVVEETGPDKDVPEGLGFPPGTRTKFYTNHGKHARFHLKLPQPPTVQSVGVFYTETYYNGKSVVLSTIKISKSGK